MNNIQYNLKTTGLAIVLMSFFATMSCGKDIPVQEMDAARKEIDAATKENAQKHSPESYNKSREALLSAHKNLADDQLSDAKKNALESKSQAMIARSVSAPKNMAAKSSKAKSSLAEADDVYSEALAPRDYAAAKELYEDGEKLSGVAKSSAASSDLSDSLYNYSEAARKYEASNEASVKAKNLALSQKGDVLDSLGGIRSRLDKADVYGASQKDPDAVSSARSKLDEAEKLINQDKIKVGYLKMKEAEKESSEILALVESQYAKTKLAEATKRTNESDVKYKAVNNKSNQATIEKKAILATIGEQVGAAKEALGSSNNFYTESKFSDSINESEEAIRLSQIIIEQADIMAGVSSTNRNFNANMADGNFKKYEVKTQKPADSLWRIARQKEHYGNGHKWKRIFKANKSLIKNPNLIYPGQVLLIPHKDGKNTESKKTEIKDEVEKKVKEEVKKEIKETVKDKLDEMEKSKENSE